MIRLACSKRDRVAYWSYVRLCCTAGVPPLAASEWLTLRVTKPKTRKSQPKKKTKARLTRCAGHPTDKAFSDGYVSWPRGELHEDTKDWIPVVISCVFPAVVYKNYYFDRLPAKATKRGIPKGGEVTETTITSAAVHAAIREGLAVGKLANKSNAMPKVRHGKVVLTKNGKSYQTEPSGSYFVTAEPVRSQTTRNTKGEHKLVARLCHLCSRFLPAHRFSKNGKLSGRSICKPCDNRRRRPLTISEVRNPVDKAYAIRAERASPLRTLKVRTRALLNWCPDCKDYRHENHSQPCREVIAMAMAAD